MYRQILFFLLISSMIQVVAGQSTPHPNIVIIMTDQQTANAMSAAGNKELRTPAMDRLAENGVRFTRAYCAQPLCTPSRTSIFSGKMPFETGVVANFPSKDGLWPDSLLVMGKLFKNNGYKTAYVGKWHLPLLTENIDKHGFEYIQNTDFLDFNDAATPSYCARFIKENRANPFLLVASFLNPHDICEWARKDPLKMDILEAPPHPDQCPRLPANWAIPANEPKIVRDQQSSNPLTYPTVNWTANQWRQYRWAYNRLVEKVDGYISMILASLKKYGVEKNTIILFTSDHGDGYAAHQWNQKQILYEEVVNVPFIISKLNEWEARTDDMLVCNGTDIIPTICGFAGIKPPSYLKGVDISSRIVDAVTNLRDTLVIETDFADNDKLLGITGRAVITKNLKYIVYNKGAIKEQLFDLSKDPGEMTNLAVDKSYKMQLLAMRSYLKKWCIINNDPFINEGCL